MEGGVGPSFLPREEAARRRQPSTAGKKVGPAPLWDRGRAAQQANPVWDTPERKAAVAAPQAAVEGEGPGSWRRNRGDDSM